ncbi:MAG: TM0106 family RecB-like putative nuclease [Candidatus Woesearchaeota archaeon]
MKTKHPDGPVRIHASQFYNYVQCPTRVYLNIYGDKSRKLAVSDFMLKKSEEGILHEKDVIADKDFVEVTVRDEAEAAKATLKMMEDGVELIYQGVLINDGMIGRPDFLMKRKGTSKFGDYHYIAVDIKSGKHLKEEYRMQVVFYSYMLELIQDRRPTVGIIINAEKQELEFNISVEIEKFNSIFDEVKSISKGSKSEPAVSAKCAECVWREYCYEYLEKKKDISLVYKLSRVHKEQLNVLGINTLKDLAQSDLKVLMSVKGMGKKTAERFRMQAQSLLSGKELVVSHPRIPDSPVEIFFDIEGETDLGIDYLYGLLVRKDGVETYHAFWADKPEDEKKMWKEFCRFIKQFDDFRVYYYTSYERTSIKRLKELYGMDEKLFERMSDNMHDVFKMIIGHVVLPLYSYSIKPIAKHLSYKWDDKKAGGAQSMLWYQEWLDSGDLKIKEKILQYNKNDCEATRVVLDWLKGLKEAERQEHEFD